MAASKQVEISLGVLVDSVEGYSMHLHKLLGEPQILFS